MLRSFLKMLFGLRARDRLDIAPRMYSNPYDRRVERDVEKVFTRSHARSPENVEQLVKRHGVRDVQELLEQLPSRQRRANPRQRLHNWLMRNRGLLPYDPVRPLLRSMIERGHIPSDGTLIARSRYPYRTASDDDDDSE